MASDKNIVSQEPSLFAAQKRRFVSRGGEKLQAAIENWKFGGLFTAKWSQKSLCPGYGLWETGMETAK